MLRKEPANKRLVKVLRKNRGTGTFTLNCRNASRPVFDAKVSFRCMGIPISIKRMIIVGSIYYSIQDEEYPLNVHIPSLEDQPFVADRSKRRTPIVGERSSYNMQRSIAGFLDEVSPSSSTSTRHSEMQEDSNDRDRSRSMISTKQEGTNPAEQLSSGRPSRAASSKIRSYKEPNRKQKMRRSS
ncbi:unnamed protein product [Toxocara canis]|uniref:Uncharacterized protein n=1 Tax=Toxocara canis TaxID=6265 RepID=A0A183TZX3_TOXCA|nr:unnamed protein product [Toxocara canis]